MGKGLWGRQGIRTPLGELRDRAGRGVLPPQHLGWTRVSQSLKQADLQPPFGLLGEVEAASLFGYLPSLSQ